VGKLHWQLDAFGRVHTLLTQTAGVMQVAMFDPHAAPSAATAPHVPCFVLVAPLQVAPLVQSVYVLVDAEKPQGPPAAPVCTCAQTLDIGWQKRPCVRSQFCAIGSHAPPACTGMEHVVFEQTSVCWHGCAGSHVAPVAPGDTQAPIVATAAMPQTRAAWQSPFAVHGPPAADCVAHAPQTAVDAILQ
jgi:hypothetical protein